MALWRSFLNVDYDIFEPVEEAELRFTLKTQKNTASMTSIKKAIEGNVSVIE